VKTLNIILLALLLVAPCMAAYTPEQQTTLDGMRLSFQLGVAYQQAQAGQNVAGFNALVDQYNAFVRTNFGEDPNLLATKMAENSAVNLQKPYVLGVNTTSRGIVHSIDGSNKYGPQYTTNDINLLPDWAIAAYHRSEMGEIMGDEYLGGV